mmetsp:Transcript_84/g.78  ORF Transcript_84/g.78 Transcript_84/m.78 type:complete len:446 (+) Transcript_84:178-1515(+)
MKPTTAALITLLSQASAFAPTQLSRTAFNVRSNKFTHSAIVDPSILADAHQHIDTLSNFFSSITLSDVDVTDSIATLTDAVTTSPPPAEVAVPAIVDAVPAVVNTAAPAAADAAVATADPGNGWFGFLEGPIEYLLQLIHAGLSMVGMSENSWGLTIIAMTTVIKLLTYPLTAQQLESTGKMQSLQPVIKDLQAKYQSNPEVMNTKISQVYQENDVNPLAGCIPSLAQIPIFIGLYRAVLTLAKDNKLNEPFLWLPNLEGPTYGADPAHASDWLLKGWVDGVPSLGWENTLLFLSIPVVLIISQSVSMNLMATKDQEQPAFIKFLPLLIGWFSLNVPAALGIYWVANNIITTALTLQIRSGLKPPTPAAAGSGSSAGASVMDVESSFTPAPLREKPAGFGSSDWEDDSDGVQPITPTEAVDAEIVENAPPKKRGGKKKRGEKNKN